MSWMGKILGGGLGFVIGGPIGAVLGAVIGHHTLDAGTALSFQEQRQSVFFLATFSMLGKLSKADGVVSAEEVAVVERVMDENLQLSPDARRFAIEIFSAAKDSEDSFEDFANQFYEEFAGQPQALSSLIDMLLMLAHSDGVLHPMEEAMIESAVSIFHLANEYQQLKARYSSTNDLDNCYEVLGASGDESLGSIKKKYRKLAMEFHPDRLHAQGVSPEFSAQAEDRFKDIQHALDVIEKHHKQ